VDSGTQQKVKRDQVTIYCFSLTGSCHFEKAPSQNSKKSYRVTEFTFKYVVTSALNTKYIDNKLFVCIWDVRDMFSLHFRNSDGDSMASSAKCHYPGTRSVLPLRETVEDNDGVQPTYTRTLAFE